MPTHYHDAILKTGGGCNVTGHLSADHDIDCASYGTETSCKLVTSGPNQNKYACVHKPTGQSKIVGWGTTTAIAIAVLVADLACIWYSKDSLTFAVAGTGLITFFGILMISNYYKSQNPHVEDVGAMRQALAGSLFAVYFVILGVTLQRPDISASTGTVLKAITDNFWAIILSVIAFYFGSKGAQSVAKTLKNKNGSDATP